MQLSELITVAPRYTRAINLERDAATPGAIDGYTVTITAREFLNRLAQSLTAPAGHRAWTLTGPYGSGKSALALYLANLFSPSASAANKLARSILKEQQPDVEVLAEVNKSLIGSPEAAKILGVCKYYVHDLTVAGMLKPLRGPHVDGSGINLYLRDDVKKLREERDAFKAARIERGKTTRFGYVQRSRPRPVLDLIGPRIDILIKEWSAQVSGHQISGAKIFRQLVKEKYKVGICSVYTYLRSLSSIEASG